MLSRTDISAAGPDRLFRAHRPVHGGAIYTANSSAQIINNTFVENWVGSGTWPDGITPMAYGGAVHITNPVSPVRHVTLLNNIFHNNLALDGKSVACTFNGIASIAYSNAYPGQSEHYYAYPRTAEHPLTSLSLNANTCWFVDPLFDTAGYWLTSASPLYTQYHGTSDVLAPENDIIGTPRPTGDYTEIGAYEYVE